MTKIAELQRNEAGIAAALDELAQAFGPNLLTGQAIREQHGHTTTWIETQAPDGVGMARSTDDVAQAVRIC
ncbi:MAG: FAD-binding oxidoreductase, partial [Alphaproteobacteria bacterium]